MTLSALLLVSSCTTFRSGTDDHPYLFQNRDQMYAATWNEGPSIFLETAMDYFELRLPAGARAWWTRTGPNKETALYVFEPERVRGTMVYVHGYLSHSLSAAFLIWNLLDQGFRVVCADLPGHGLSDGERGDIATFSDYGLFVGNLHGFCEDRWTGPVDYMGHSTGCAAMHEYLRQGYRGYNRIIFLAPLVRTWLWDVSLAGLSLTEKFTEAFPAFRNEVSRDKNYLRKSKLDHLRLKQVPVHWVRALERWNEELKTDAVPITREILILQGTADTAVDAPYGKEYYDRLLTGHTYVEIPKAIHCLHSDKKAFREKAFREINRYLSEE